MSACTINQAIEVLCNLKVPASTSFAFLHLWILNKNNLCFHLSDPRCKHVFLLINLNKRYLLQASVSYTCTCNILNCFEYADLGYPQIFRLFLFYFCSMFYIGNMKYEVIDTKYRIDIMSQVFDWNYLPLKII